MSARDFVASRRKTTLCWNAIRRVRSTDVHFCRASLSASTRRPANVVGNLSYDSRYANLLFEVVMRRYDAQKPLLLSTNKASTSAAVSESLPVPKRRGELHQDRAAEIHMRFVAAQQREEPLLIVHGGICCIEAIQALRPLRRRGPTPDAARGQKAAKRTSAISSTPLQRARCGALPIAARFPVCANAETRRSRHARLRAHGNMTAAIERLLGAAPTLWKW
jgi:hypothetical protein